MMQREAVLKALPMSLIPTVDDSSSVVTSSCDSNVAQSSHSSLMHDEEKRENSLFSASSSSSLCKSLEVSLPVSREDVRTPVEGVHFVSSRDEEEAGGATHKEGKLVESCPPHAIKRDEDETTHTEGKSLYHNSNILKKDEEKTRKERSNSWEIPLPPLNSSSEEYAHTPEISHSPSRRVEGAVATTSSTKLVETCRCFSIDPLDEVPVCCAVSEKDFNLLMHGHHSDPFSILGCHLFVSSSQDGVEKTFIAFRIWLKDAQTVRLKIKEEGSNCRVLPKKGSLFQMSHRGELLFEKVFVLGQPAEKVTEGSKPFPFCSYEVLAKFNHSGDEEITIYDPYASGLLLPEFDLELFQSGSCWNVDDLLGSHNTSINGVEGVRFSVWAPNCIAVSVVGDWNQWDPRVHPMRKRFEYGVWELFLPGKLVGNNYGYRIHSKSAGDFIKIDPYAQEYENPPAMASVISGCDDSFKEAKDRFVWHDEEWMRRRSLFGKKDLIRRLPISIYEVHLPSWMRGNGNSYLGYEELADRLVAHMKLFNFTHVEFLPVAQHPFEGSWGYQVMGLYAPYSRLGNPDNFKYLVDRLHANDIGVFIDFVPAHFCKDAWGLVCYDGEPCYEYADPREGDNFLWGTKVFNFRRNEVRSFLLGAAYHWLRRYHIDGLRIDAVSSMLYKNHCRSEGNWLPNEKGGVENLQAITLLQEMNWVVHELFPGVYTMAEESTSWCGVTDKKTGLGFDAKWDLGWMNDTLSYLCLPMELRPTNHSKLTFRGLYMSHESWILPLSHDEVVSGKGSVLDKCGYRGVPFEDRIRTMRTLFGFQIGLPGRPLIFMGSEFAQGREWKGSRSIDWHEMEEDLRKKFAIWVQDLLAVYKHKQALYAGDDESWNFKWTDCDNQSDCVISFLRSYGVWTNDILVVCNFSGSYYASYPIGVPHGGEWQVLLNSDDWRYGGTMAGPGNLQKIHTTQGGRLGWDYCLWIDIPPFGCLYLQAPQLLAGSAKRLALDALIDEQEKIISQIAEGVYPDVSHLESTLKSSSKPSGEKTSDANIKNTGS